MGIIYEDNGNHYVYEAIQPVKSTQLDTWIKRGKNGYFVEKRLKNADKKLTSDILRKMKEVGEGFKGKNYDLYFEWSDERFYCSELVWKIYKRALNIEIGELQKIQDIPRFFHLLPRTYLICQYCCKLIVFFDDLFMLHINFRDPSRHSIVPL